MLFIVSVVIIALISIGLALWSLRGVDKKGKAKKKLDKGKVVFHSPSSSA